MFGVIMAGGSGTRFWPLSRKGRPKQFLNITGGGPMIVETCDRLRPLMGYQEMAVVLGVSHLDEASRLLQGTGIHLLAEPVGRNTAPCMGLGALYAKHHGAKGPVAFLPADHFIADPERFLSALSVAAERVAHGGIATLGIVPIRPETGFGYIRRAHEGEMKGKEAAYRVLAFVEKPDAETALRYVSSGEYYWNAGIFVATADTILHEIRTHLPAVHDALMRLDDTMGTDRFVRVLSEIYPGLPSISFDYGVMEKTRQAIHVVPCECGWSDVGSWASLYDLRSKEHDDAQNLTEGQTLAIDCRRTFISAHGGRMVVGLGLSDCLVVDAGDVVLVAHRDRAQDVRKIVDALKEDGKEDLI
jgi:mannose-1-phosphate guanylyltransferase/mannose-6-phosphate isomerase